MLLIHFKHAFHIRKKLNVDLKTFSRFLHAFDMLSYQKSKNGLKKTVFEYFQAFCTLFVHFWRSNTLKA